MCALCVCEEKCGVVYIELIVIATEAVEQEMAIHLFLPVSFALTNKPFPQVSVYRPNVLAA